MSFVIDTPEGIAAVRVITLMHSLRFEIETGMKMTRFSLLNVCKRDYGITARTKKAALAELEAMFPELA
jgi:hypothetical protein